jgi:hypothetical protein
MRVVGIQAEGVWASKGAPAYVDDVEKHLAGIVELPSELVPWQW